MSERKIMAGDSGAGGGSHSTEWAGDDDDDGWMVKVSRMGRRVQSRATSNFVFMVGGNEFRTRADSFT